MMFVPRPNQSGDIDAVRCLRHPALAAEYRNRARTVLDLFAADGSIRGGQVGQLAADLGAALTPTGYYVDWPRLDEVRWDFHPRTATRGAYFAREAVAWHGGRPWVRTLESADFAGFRQYVVAFYTDTRPVKDYAPHDGDPRGYGWGYLAHEAADDQVPAEPTAGTAAEWPKAGTYRFEASAFASPAGGRTVALEWRVGRVGQRGWYELADYWKEEVATGRTVDI